MSSKHLLFLEAGRLSAYVRKKGRLEGEGTFAASPEERNNFAQYLSGRRQGRFYLLANLAEEAYASESIPLLWGRERRMLIARKARQHFPEPALICVESAGREKTTRRNENLLIAALTAPEQLQPWLAALKDAEAALGGIFSPAQFSGRLLERLGHKAPQCLLLCLFGRSLRETYLSNGQAVFSRLIAIDDTSPPALANCFVTEATRLHQYLSGQRRIGRETRLPIFILVHPSAIKEVERVSATAADLDLRIIDSHLAARRLKLEPLPKDSCCVPLFLHLLDNRQAREQFAVPALRLDFRLAQGRRLIWCSAFCLLAASGLGTAHTLHQTRLLGEASERMAEEEQRMRKRHQDIIASFPKTDTAYESIRYLMERYDELAKRRNELPSRLFLLGRVLDKIDDIELDNLDWRIEKIAPGARTSLPQESISLNGHRQGENPEVLRRQVQANLEQFSDLLRSTSACTAEIARPLLMTDFTDDSAPQSGDAGTFVRQHFSLRITCRQ